MWSQFQNDLIDHYLDRLSVAEESSSVETILRECLNDPQLYLYDEIFESVRDKIRPDRADSLFEILELLSYGESLGVSKDTVFWKKLAMLTIVSVVQEVGWKNIEFEYLRNRTGIDSDLELMRLLIEMNETKMIKAMIDERNRQINVIDLSIARIARDENLSALENQLREIISRIDSCENDDGMIQLKNLMNMLNTPVEDNSKRGHKRGRISEGSINVEEK